MGKEKTIGKCKLCGKETQLTYEHVPPRATFNSSCVKVVTDNEIKRLRTEKNRLPWDLKRLQRLFLQRGNGGYYLCEKCNSIMGAWYVPKYNDFVFSVHDRVDKIITEDDYSSENVIQVYAKSIYPLAIVKQIITMFCDINNQYFGDDSIQEFLLNKESRTFDKKKYRVFIHIAKGTLEKQVPLMVKKYDNIAAPISLSEIVTYPIGFTLYIDVPTEYIPKGLEITYFADYQYSKCCDIVLNIPILECNTSIPGDYRTKEEILKYKD